MSTNDKKNMYYIIILILTLLIFVVASTFAYFSMVASKKENSTKIYTGTVQISYEQGTLLQGIDIKPSKNEDSSLIPPYDATENVAKSNFTITNKGTLTVNLNISLADIISNFSDNSLNYVIYNNSSKKRIITGTIPKNGILLDKFLLNPNETGDYTLLIWLPDTDENQNVDSNKNFSARLYIDASNKY